MREYGEIYSNDAEAMAIQLALESWPGVPVFSDNKSMAEAFEAQGVTWIPREQNKFADWLSRWKGTTLPMQ